MGSLEQIPLFSSFPPQGEAVLQSLNSLLERFLKRSLLFACLSNSTFLELVVYNYMKNLADSHN